MSDTTKPTQTILTFPGFEVNLHFAFFSTAIYQIFALLVIILVNIFAFQRLQIPFIHEQSLIPLASSFIFLGAGGCVSIFRNTDRSSQVFSIFSASAAVSVSSLLVLEKINNLTCLLSLFPAITGGALLHLATIFPQPIFKPTRRSWLVWISYISAVILVILSIFSQCIGSLPSQTIENIQNYFLSLAIFTLISSLIFHLIKSKTTVIRKQAAIILIGTLIAFFPFLLRFFLHRVSTITLSLSTYFLIPLAAFPLSIAHALIHFQTIKTNIMLRHSTQYGIASLFVASGYALLVGGLSLIIGERLFINYPFLLGILLVILALLLNPLRNQLQTQINRFFFRNQQGYQKLLEDFNQTINTAIDVNGICLQLRDFIRKSLSPRQLHIFLFDSKRDRFFASPDESGHPSTDIEFIADSPLPQLLRLEQKYFYLPDRSDTPVALMSENSRISLLSGQLFIPLRVRTDQIYGFMSLAPKQTGRPYSDLDLKLLTSLSEQAAIAIERNQIIKNLERRVEELNVLTRVAQGINITLHFDDILELIYAQANHIIPCRDFFILLFDKASNIYYFTFYLEDDRRLLQIENKPLTSNADLAVEVIQTGQQLITDDYKELCAKRGIKPQVKGLHTWIGLPLNSGAETMGAISLGIRDQSVYCSNDQIELLQAIADQAAGAILKAQLLEESEGSALRLSLLNEISRNLTSMLDLPNLLNQILVSAINLINCQTGTLYLVDDGTGELVSIISQGNTGQSTQKNIIKGQDPVHLVFKTGEATIINRAHIAEEWEEEKKRSADLPLEDLLIVPMIIQDRVIGVIEIVNRKDSLPFSPEDQDLLTAFSSQAAIALENARLYTLTDQQLADRVDELSVMQRIDRELNASLNINRAMRITLEWALRRSGAEAGFIGSVTDDGIHIIAERGYTSELDPYRSSILPFNLPGIRKTLELERNQQIFRPETFVTNHEASYILKNAQNQIIIPIRSEDRVTGLLLLESRKNEPWSEDTQQFLSRLTEHAAIAIANAQLFSQVQEANIAKSEFVSFVSHELKTPMTSIRGYTDLLIGGAVGEINDAQRNFLYTIRTNVNRMATLVSDLADVSRIEAGRLRFDFSSVSMYDVVQEVIRSQTTNLEDKKHILKVDIPEDLSPAWGDQVRIVQVFTNLMSNANKYTQQGGQISIDASEMDNEWDPDGAPTVILISVQDNGIGISKEDQKQIFTKFFRSADPKAREAPGTGLGLNITRYLVEMQGGKIWFKSQLGIGSTFYFTIPTAQV